MLRPTTRILRSSLVAYSIPRTQKCRNSNFGASSSSRNQRTQKNNYGGVIKDGAPTLLIDNRCAFIQTWDFIRNPAEALALIRAVEIKYGPVESFSFRNDFDSPNLYQVHIRIIFRDIESFNRLPKDNVDKLHIRAPTVQAKRPGGIGLDEIAPFVNGEVEFLTANQVSEMQSERTIDFRIERADRPYIEDSPYPFVGVNQHYRREVGMNLLEWGGFHEMEPMESTRTISNEELTDETLDHVYMRRTLREWAEFLKVRNPYEIYPDSKETVVKDAIEKSSQVQKEVKSKTATKPPANIAEWEPLDVTTSPNIPDPIEKLMEMEDIKVTSLTTSEHVSESLSSKESPELQSEHPQTSLKSPTTPDLRKEPLQDILSENSTPNAESEPVQIAGSDLKSTSTSEVTTTSDTYTTPNTAESPITPTKQETSDLRKLTKGHSTSRPPTSEEKILNSIKQEELELQLEEARKLGAMARSSQRQKKKGGEVKAQNTFKKVRVKEEVKKERASEKSKASDLEANPRFSGLFSKIQSIFGR